jgi:hypothetical protein
VGETTKVIALEGDIVTGLVRVNVFVRVTLKYVEVEFLNCQNVPPCAVVTAAVAGVTILLNAEFVM